MPCAFSFIPVPHHKIYQKFKIVISLNMNGDPLIVYIVLTVDIDMCLCGGNKLYKNKKTPHYGTSYISELWWCKAF